MNKENKNQTQMGAKPQQLSALSKIPASGVKAGAQHMRNANVAQTAPPSGAKGVAGNGNKLPEIGHKFSSWTQEDQNLNELDELLMEHDLIVGSPGVGGKPSKHNGGSAGGLNNFLRANRSGEPHSPEHFDFEEVIDEFGDSIEAGGADLENQKRSLNKNSSSENEGSASKGANRV